jgi:NAD(P)-dependent dehydrogenase (short-subunit alcohol dehydrogenase family)
MSTRYHTVHQLENLAGPGDARPTAMQIIEDEKLINKLTDKTFLVTGVSGGIGIETLRALHATGAHVFGTVRSLPKGQGVVDEILASNPNGGKIDLIEMKLDSLESVRRGAAEFLQKSGGKCNILIANAGIMAVPEAKTVDGFESQFATNYLSHFLLFQLLREAMLSSATPDFPSRLILVSSLGHRSSPVRFGDYNFTSSGYDKYAAYGQSKTAMIWFANAVNRKYSSRNLYALALHPGLIYTALGDALTEEEKAPWMGELPRKVAKSLGQGAATTVFAAVGEEWKKVGGVWVSDCEVQGRWGVEGQWDMKQFLESGGYADYAFDDEGEERLWRESIEMVGLKEEK